jgi:hypothetical protein
MSRFMAKASHGCVSHSVKARSSFVLSRLVWMGARSPPPDPDARRPAGAHRPRTAHPRYKPSITRDLLHTELTENYSMKREQLHFGSRPVISVEMQPLQPADAEFNNCMIEQYKLFVDKTHSYWIQLMSTNELFLKIHVVALSAFGATNKTDGHLEKPLALVRFG